MSEPGKKTRRSVKCHRARKTLGEALNVIEPGKKDFWQKH